MLLEGVLLVEGCRALSYMLGWLEQSELEDLSFMFAHPEEYVEVKHRVQVLCKEQEEVVLEVNSFFVGLSR